MHQTISSNLRAILHHHPPQNLPQAKDIIDTCFAAAAYASKTAIHCTLNISPGALVFHRDMILDIPLITDLQLLHKRRQTLIDDQLRRSNLHQRHADYQPGGSILLLTENPSSIQNRAFGPFLITQVHTNGTVTFQRSQFIQERINIRRIKPYRT